MNINNFYSAADVVNSVSDKSSHLKMALNVYDDSKLSGLSSIAKGIVSGEYNAVILVGYGGVAVPTFITKIIDSAFQQSAPNNDIRHACAFIDQHKKSKVPTYLRMRVPSSTPSDSILKVLPNAISGITHSLIIADEYTGEISAGVVVVRLWDISPIKDGKQTVTIQVGDIHGEEPDEILETRVIKRAYANAFNAFISTQSLSASSRLISLLDKAIKRIRVLKFRGALKDYVEDIGEVNDDNALPVSIQIANGTLMATFSIGARLVNTNIAWMGRVQRMHGQTFVSHKHMGIKQFHEEYYADAVKNGNNILPAVEPSASLTKKAIAGEAITVNFEGFPIGLESTSTTVNNIIAKLVGDGVKFTYNVVKDGTEDVSIRRASGLVYPYGNVFTKEIVTKDKTYLSRFYQPYAVYTPHADYVDYTTLDLSKCSPDDAAKQLAELYYGDISYTFASILSPRNEFTAWPSIRYDKPVKVTLNPNDRRAIHLALSVLAQ